MPIPIIGRDLYCKVSGERRGTPRGYPHQFRYTQQIVPVNRMEWARHMFTQQIVPVNEIGAGRAHYAYGRLRQRLCSVQAIPPPYIDIPQLNNAKDSPATINH
jgi:hypothetical protein